MSMPATHERKMANNQQNHPHRGDDRHREQCKQRRDASETAEQTNYTHAVR